MDLFEVGKPFEEGITRYPENVRFDMDDEGCNLLIYMIDPKEEMRQAITAGEFKYGYFKEDNVIIMLFKFGNGDWLDVPYSIHMHKILIKVREVTENNGFPLKIYVINAKTGILEGYKLVELDIRLSKMLREDILEQKDLSYNGFHDNINEFNRKYSTKALVSMSRALI